MQTIVFFLLVLPLAIAAVFAFPGYLRWLKFRPLRQLRDRHQYLTAVLEVNDLEPSVQRAVEADLRQAEQALQMLQQALEADASFSEVQSLTVGIKGQLVSAEQRLFGD